MKVLCLHGYTQNGSLFAKKASGLRKALKKAGMETVFPDGPLKVEVDDLPFEPSPELLEVDMRAWWRIDNTKPDTYGNTGPAFEAIKEVVEKEGPFDGILGFSQGAGLAAILTKAIPELVPGHPPLKFAIIYAGFRQQAEASQHWYETPFTTPALLIMGSADTLVPEEKGMALYECWDPSKRSLLKHPGGHYTPSQKPHLQAVTAWVNETLNPSEEAKPQETEKKGEWNEFDNIGK